MSRRLIARMEVLLQGNVTRQARRFGGDMETMGERGSRAMDRMDRRARMVGDGIGRLARSAGALAGAFVGIQEARRLATLQERYERLGIAAGKSTEDMQAMRRAVEETAQADDIRIDPAQLLGAIEAFTEATGEIDIADAMKREIALAIQATGSGGQEIGKLMASVFSKFEIDTPDDMLAALDLLARQGKDGAIELTNLAALGPKVFSAYASLGKGGIQGLAEAGALMQIFKRGVGSAEEAGTVFENVFNALGKKTILDKLEQKGVEIRDSAGALLQPVELLKAVVEAAGADDMKLGGVFDAEAMRGLRQMSDMFRKDGGFGDLDTIIDLRLEADGTSIEADSARIAATAGAAAADAVEEARSAVGDAIEEMELLEMFADAIGSIEKEDVELLFKAAGGIGALWAAFKVGGAVKDGVALFRTMRGGVSFGASSIMGGLPSGASMMSTGGVQSVLVTNWPGGLGHNDGSGASAAEEGFELPLGNAALATGALALGVFNNEAQITKRADELVEQGLPEEEAQKVAVSETQEGNKKGLYQTPVIRELTRFSVIMRHMAGQRADEELYAAYPDLAKKAPVKQELPIEDEEALAQTRRRHHRTDNPNRDVLDAVAGGGAGSGGLGFILDGSLLHGAVKGPSNGLSIEGSAEVVEELRAANDQLRDMNDRLEGVERELKRRPLPIIGGAAMREVHP